MLDIPKILQNSGDATDGSKDWPQILALFLASICGISAGNLFAFSSPAIPKLVSDYNFTIEQASYFTVIPPIAMIIATPIFCKLTDKIGRKYTLLITGTLHVTSWVLIAFAKTIWVFYFSRAIYGISDACLFAALPVYIAEVSTPKVRSLYGNIIVVSIFVGQFLSNCIGFHFTISNSALIMLSVPLLFLASFVFMPDTPYYLIMTNDVDGARRSLQKLRGCDHVEAELKQLVFDVHRQLSESGDFKNLWLIKSNRRALIVANLCRFFQQFSGFGALVVYSQYIFQLAGGNISSGVASMIVSGILAFVNLFANFISDKIGRKKSMVLSCLGCGVMLLGEAIYFYLQANVNLAPISWFPIVALVGYTCLFSIGLGVVPTLMLGEMFSTSIRKHATTICNIAFGLSVCILTKVFQLMMSAFGLWVPFLLFSICCFISSIASYFIVPETKGKTLEEIQQMLKGNVH
ncbi:hypothetical protein Trydic_g4148 [Trypoxylus dichotomus]